MNKKKKFWCTKSKAKNILERNEVRGNPLSEKQINFFKLIASGWKPKEFREEKKEGDKNERGEHHR